MGAKQATSFAYNHWSIKAGFNPVSNAPGIEQGKYMAKTIMIVDDAGTMVRSLKDRLAFAGFNMDPLVDIGAFIHRLPDKLARHTRSVRSVVKKINEPVH